MGQESSFVQNFLQLSFDLVFVSLAQHLLGRNRANQPGGVGGVEEPPHFFEINFLDTTRNEVGGDFPQSLFHFIIKHTTTLAPPPSPPTPPPIFLKYLGQSAQLSYKKLKKNPTALYNKICLKR